MADAWVKLALGEGAIVSSDEPVAVDASTASAGNDPNASRDDHVHVLGADCVTGDEIADDAVGSEHIEALSAALDCGQQELQYAVLHNAAEAPATPAVGQVYFNTGDSSVYLRVAGA
jgi:hypothetical protein